VADSSSAGTINFSERAEKSGAYAAHAQAGLGLSIVFLMPLILSQDAILAPQGIEAVPAVADRTPGQSPTVAVHF
jgi:hypothetical protein